MCYCGRGTMKRFMARTENNYGSTRLIVELWALKHPGFLRLLEMAEEDYGLGQGGALAVPCGPDELQRILEDK
ncbi:SAUR-like auxin-responsive protein family [Striga hermonthica]|uniref:SAUR-like auxin-responsive protein family n=1 Tax=Striga hermonthica TaxID=68872 RepID=A0A9N7MLU3_STRHE|nr:SAUR-like auxin-responsive protein family [Striga hermonthica]